MDTSLHEAMLWEKRAGSVVRCHVCQWRCVIKPEKLGLCQVRRNVDGALYVLNYAEVSSVAIDPIEKKPLFHFYPGTRVFSLGGWGCNFHCRHCQNWQISCAVPDEPAAREHLSPEASVKLALQNRCSGIAWTYNEPGIWLEYTLDSAKLAKSRELYTVYVTNGYSTPEALDAVGPYLDAWRVDIKGFSGRPYLELATVSRWRGILEVAERAKKKWDMHVEVVTNVIPTLNDDDAQLQGIANWIKESLGELTPWHITRFYPNYQFADLPPTPIATLEHAYDIGRQAGLKFVYLGNVPGDSRENTVCYSCGKPVIQRLGYDIRIVGLEGSRCRSCSTELNIRVGARN